ncbi:AraC family transcriptional regulator [Aquisediminimonas sediminicola]|uniref:AraC family transcriptional regulator n=1 Tax=Alteraquisediminimonas sediminicola TaxID=2676787 RepID=UPI001C8E05F5|nr:AraC family transcriptional regulator [Aquisediminimonas sediminicola]
MLDRSAIEALLMPITYGRHLARLFDLERIFAGTGLTQENLQDPEYRITVAQLLTYTHNTLELAEDPAWYYEWANSLADHFHGPASIALVSAPTLGHGIDAFLRYFPSRIPYMHMQGRHEGEYFYAELCPLIDLGAVKPILVETPIVLLQKHLETVYGVDLSQVVLELDYPATAHADRCRAYFPFPVHFGTTRNALVIPAEWRALRNLGHVESTWVHALAQCEATMASSVERETLGRVRACLASGFEREDRLRPLPTLDEVAASLHLTSRTLIRRLRRLGTSYREVTDEFLRARARELLANDQMKIKQVSALLGFDSPANFGKAFKRWYGVSPGSFRSGPGRPASEDV